MVLCFALIIATSDPLCRVHFSESRKTVCGPVCHTSVFHWHCLAQAEQTLCVSECLHDAVWMNQIFLFFVLFF